jgi:hypothetical protein
MAEGSRVRHVTVEGFEYEGDGDDDDEVLVFAVCPTRSRRGRCSRCDRKCRGYNQGGGRRRWRSLDLGTTRRLVISQVMLSFPFALIPLLLITPPPGHHGTLHQPSDHHCRSRSHCWNDHRDEHLPTAEHLRRLMPHRPRQILGHRRYGRRLRPGPAGTREYAFPRGGTVVLMPSAYRASVGHH